MLQTDECLAGVFLMWCVRLLHHVQNIGRFRALTRLIIWRTLCRMIGTGSDHSFEFWICWHRYFSFVFLQFLTILLLLPYVSCIVTVFMWLRVIILQRYNMCYLWISVKLIGPTVKHCSLFYWLVCFNYNSKTESKICTVAGNNRGKMPQAYGWILKCWRIETTCQILILCGICVLKRT